MTFRPGFFICYCSNLQMKLWLSKNSEVPVRDQLVAQVTIGIASGDLRAGEKLPSTREIARRFGVHQNTVSSAYRELASQGLVEFRPGSGVYIGSSQPAAREDNLDSLITKFLNEAEVHGYSRVEALKRVEARLESDSVSGFLVVEPTDGLREILVSEIETAIGLPARGISPEELSQRCPDGFQLTAMFDEAEKLGSVLPPDSDCIYLKAHSVSGSLDGQQRPSEGDLIGIASGWDDFLVLARMFLLAAKIDPDAIVACCTRIVDWKKSLSCVSTIICDTVTAEQLAGDSRVRVFPIIADSSLDELRRAAAINT